MGPRTRSLLAALAFSLAIAYLFLPGPMHHARALSAANQSIAALDLARIREALHAYAFDRGRYPAVLEELLVADPREIGYLNNRRRIPPDPWRRPYRYSPGPDGTRFVLSCLGRDGKPGGTGEDQDLWIDSRATR